MKRLSLSKRKRLVEEDLYLAFLQKAFEAKKENEFFDIEWTKNKKGAITGFSYSPKAVAKAWVDKALTRIFSPSTR